MVGWLVHFRWSASSCRRPPIVTWERFQAACWGIGVPSPDAPRFIRCISSRVI